MRKVDPAKHRARRRQIMDAAAPLFAAQGFEATSTAEIRTAAGLSSGALFHYFPSKRAIFAAILTDEDGGNAEKIAAVRSAEDPRAALLELVEHLAGPAADPVAPSLVMEGMLQAHRDPELAELMERGSDTEHEAMAELLARAAAEDRIALPFPAEETASWIHGLIGALFLRAATETGFDAAAQLPRLRTLVLRLLGEGEDRPGAGPANPA